MTPAVRSPLSQPTLPGSNSGNLDASLDLSKVFVDETTKRSYHSAPPMMTSAAQAHRMEEASMMAESAFERGAGGGELASSAPVLPTVSGNSFGMNNYASILRNRMTQSQGYIAPMSSEEAHRNYVERMMGSAAISPTAEGFKSTTAHERAARHIRIKQREQLRMLISNGRESQRDRWGMQLESVERTLAASATIPERLLGESSSSSPSSESSTSSISDGADDDSSGFENNDNNKGNDDDMFSVFSWSGSLVSNKNQDLDASGRSLRGAAGAAAQRQRVVRSLSPTPVREMYRPPTGGGATTTATLPGVPTRGPPIVDPQRRNATIHPNADDDVLQAMMRAAAAAKKSNASSGQRVRSLSDPRAPPRRTVSDIPPTSSASASTSPSIAPMDSTKVDDFLHLRYHRSITFDGSVENLHREQQKQAAMHNSSPIVPQSRHLTKLSPHDRAQRDIQMRQKQQLEWMIAQGRESQRGRWGSQLKSVKESLNAGTSDGRMMASSEPILESSTTPATYQESDDDTEDMFDVFSWGKRASMDHTANNTSSSSVMGGQQVAAATFRTFAAAAGKPTVKRRMNNAKTVTSTKSAPASSRPTSLIQMMMDERMDAENRQRFNWKNAATTDNGDAPSSPPLSPGRRRKVRSLSPPRSTSSTTATSSTTMRDPYLVKLMEDQIGEEDYMLWLSAAAGKKMKKAKKKKLKNKKTKESKQSKKEKKKAKEQMTNSAQSPSPPRGRDPSPRPLNNHNNKEQQQATAITTGMTIEQVKETDSSKKEASSLASMSTTTNPSVLASPTGSKKSKGRKSKSPKRSGKRGTKKQQQNDSDHKIQKEATTSQEVIASAQPTLSEQQQEQQPQESYTTSLLTVDRREPFVQQGRLETERISNTASFNDDDDASSLLTMLDRREPFVHQGRADTERISNTASSTDDTNDEEGGAPTSTATSSSGGVVEEDK